MKSHLLISLRMTVVLVIITCVIYPLAVFALGQALFPSKANGSFVSAGGRVVGSALIGQKFTSGRFFHSRPSAAGADGYDGTSSGGSNLGPTSKKLSDAVAERIHLLDRRTNVPADAVTASASGLDPHITPANAYAQAVRVAKANGMSRAAVDEIIRQHTEGRFLGVFGESRVNVLALNIALQQRK